MPNGFSSIKFLGYSNGKAQFGPPGSLLYIAYIVTLVLLGAGPWSVDALMRRKNPITS